MKTKRSVLEPSERFLSRREVAERWGVSTETIKRRDGVLHPLRFNQRLIRYAFSEIAKVESEAAGDQL
jgi:DNA-binding transcriptional regulator YhcF (GntR family)